MSNKVPSYIGNTSALHADKRGSNPLGDAKFDGAWIAKVIKVVGKS